MLQNIACDILNFPKMTELSFTSPILVQCHISVSPENVRKPKVFLTFSGSIEM